MQTWVSSVAGAAALALALHDIFHALFHPGGGSAVSETVFRVSWRVHRGLARRWPRVLRLAGPVGLVSVILLWTALLTLGFALLYWPRLPQEALYSEGLDPAVHSGFRDALYMSLVTLATLGYGDITPASTVLKVLAPLEAFIGFALLTASISWVLSLYPALRTRRALAHELRLLRDAEQRTGVRLLGLAPGVGAEALEDLAARLVEVRADLILYPATYYFHSPDPRSALDSVLPFVVELCTEAARPEASPDLRLRAAALHAALDDLAQVLGDRFLGCPGAPTPEVLARYAREHGQGLRGGADAPPPRDRLGRRRPVHP